MSLFGDIILGFAFGFELCLRELSLSQKGVRIEKRSSKFGDNLKKNWFILFQRIPP